MARFRADYLNPFSRLPGMVDRGAGNIPHIWAKGFPNYSPRMGITSSAGETVSTEETSTAAAARSLRSSRWRRMLLAIAGYQPVVDWGMSVGSGCARPDPGDGTY
jgi:hypothetical protein